MALPNGVLNPTTSPADWLDPDGIVPGSLLVSYERGGIALNDASQGLLVQNWRARYVGSDVLIGADPYSSETTLITELGITELSLAFDQNMQPTLAYMVGSVCKLRWFDPTLPGFVTTTMAANVRSPFLAMDDKRSAATQLARNDIIFLYMRLNFLCMRVQRDAYDTEYILRTFPGNDVTIVRSGMNNQLGFQVELFGFDAV